MHGNQHSVVQTYDTAHAVAWSTPMAPGPYVRAGCGHSCCYSLPEDLHTGSHQHFVQLQDYAAMHFFLPFFILCVLLHIHFLSRVLHNSGEASYLAPCFVARYTQTVHHLFLALILGTISQLPDASARVWRWLLGLCPVQQASQVLRSMKELTEGHMWRHNASMQLGRLACQQSIPYSQRCENVRVYNGISLAMELSLLL